MIAPVLASIVAAAVVAEVKAPPELPLLTNVVAPFEQIASVPLNVPAFGAVVTVTVLVAVAFEHPPVPVIV